MICWAFRRTFRRAFCLTKRVRREVICNHDRVVVAYLLWLVFTGLWFATFCFTAFRFSTFWFATLCFAALSFAALSFAALSLNEA